MAVSAYATPTDLSLYLSDVSTSQNEPVWTAFLNMSSRFIDQQLGQYFYDDGQYTRYFDGQGSGHVNTFEHPFFGSSGTIASVSQGATSLIYTPSGLAPRIPIVGDTLTLDVDAAKIEVVTISAVAGSGPTYTLTTTATTKSHVNNTIATTVQIQLAFFENQPLAQWTGNLSGDGVTPTSNFYFWPRNRGRVGGDAAGTARKPWYGLDLAHTSISNTTFLPNSIPGYMTVGITAHWGWPTVPFLIKDMTCKLAARAWRARQAGWSEVLGATDIGTVNMSRYFDAVDESLLVSSEYKLVAF